MNTQTAVQEEVVLVNDANEALGTMPKAEVHHAATPLHRGFSVFLFNPQGEVLLQQRSHSKKTWPLVWAGSCCGHPALGEAVEDAVRRRCAFELNIADTGELWEMLPDFRYSCERDGIVENELCPVWVGRYENEVAPNPDEVEAVTWKSWQELTEEIEVKPGSYAQWCELEVAALNRSEKFQDFFKGISKVN